MSLPVHREESVPLYRAIFISSHRVPVGVKYGHSVSRGFSGQALGLEKLLESFRVSPHGEKEICRVRRGPLVWR